jgi:hypothetical protein
VPRPDAILLWTSLHAFTCWSALRRGAAIGAASPSTEAEDELMGETSDAVKKETAELAKEQLEKGQVVAERVLQSASEEAEKQGSVSSSTEDDDDAFTSRPDAA